MPPAAAAVVGSSSSTPAAPTARVAPPTPLGVRPIGTCLPTAPWSPAGHLGAATQQGAAGSTTSASNLLYGAAPARPLPTNSLYKSPLAHVTLSVKVPHQFTPSAASNLQSMVARHVWAGEPQLAGPNSEPRDPQHTILHMVSIPGCIQLFLTVAQWQPEQHRGPPAGGPPPHTLAGPPHNSDSGPGADAQAATGPAAGGAPGDAAAASGGGAPAPAWLIQAVCSAVEEFSRTHPPEPSPADGSSSTSDQQAGASGQHYTGPVLLNVDGLVHTLQPDATNPAAAWVLQPLSEQELTQLQAGPHFSTGSPTAAAAAAAAAAATARGQPPVLWQGSRASAAVAWSGADPAASPVPETPAVTVPAHAARTPLTQLLGSQQPSSRTSLDSSTSARSSARSSSPTPAAAAHTFIRTVAQGLVAMHDQGSHGLFAPTATDSVSQGAAASSAAQAAPTSKDATELASSSSGLPGAVLSIHTSSAPATALPPKMWGWPLCLATSGEREGAASADARVAVCGSSAVIPVVSLHGVPAGSCRVVLATAAGVVLFGEVVPVEDGVARFRAPESATTMAAKIFYLLPTAASASAPDTAAAPPTPMPAGPSATSAPAAAAAMPGAASAAVPADQLLCMLPLLYLPPNAVVELCEAARALMLERSNLMFTQQLQRQQQEREHEQEQLQAQQFYASGSTLEEDSYAGALGLCGSHSPHTGTLSLAGGGDGAAVWEVAAAEAAAGRPAQGASTAAAAARMQHAVRCSPVRLGTPAELHRAAAGSSRHEGSFETTPVSSASQLPHMRAALGELVAVGAPRSDPVAAVAAPAQVCGSSQQQQQPSATSSSTTNRRVSIEPAAGAGSGTSSMYDSRTGLEDEPGQLNLRGRLFDGSSDVHQLLNNQYLAMLADLGLLIELASSSSSSTETQHASIAAEVGQQLLTCFMDSRCWSCCQLVLRLLLDLRVHLHLHGQPVTVTTIASVPAVQQLLQAAAAAAPAAVLGAAPQQQAQLPEIVPTPVSGIGRAGVWGHLPPHEFLPAAGQSPQQPGPSAQQPRTENLIAGSSSAGRDNSTHLGPSPLPAGRQHRHTSSASTSASYASCESPRPGEQAAAAPRSPPAVAAAPRAAIAWPPYTPTVLSSTAAATAAERVAVEHQQKAGAGGGVAEGEAQPSGHGSHGSRRLGILDSASEIWTRIRRHRSSSKLRQH